MKLPNGKGVFVENLNLLAQAKFVQLALAEFPELHKELDDAEGLLHLEMGTFSRFAQKGIEHNDLDTLKRCFGLIAEIMKRAPPAIENAIYVSFLEHLNFESSPAGAEARNLLPPVLKKALDEVNDHWERIGQWQVEAQDHEQRARDEKARQKPRI